MPVEAWLATFFGRTQSTSEVYVQPCNALQLAEVPESAASWDAASGWHKSRSDEQKKLGSSDFNCASR